LSSGGFGLEVQQAIKERAEHLTRENLARRDGQRLVFARDLLVECGERQMHPYEDRSAIETEFGRLPWKATRWSR
jgi:hypothetical protein